MPEWLGDLVQGPYAGVLTALVLIVVGIVKTWPWLRRLVRFVDRLIGDPDNPGLLDRVASVEQQVAPILHEVKNNSGTSMKDAIDRTEVQVRDISDRLERVEEKLADDYERINEIEDTITKPRRRQAPPD